MVTLKIDRSKAVMLVTIVIVAALFYSIYYNCILTSDDYRYMFSRFDGTLVTDFNSAWKSFAAEYLNWSGRLAHLWDILLLLSKGAIWRVATPLLLAIMPFLLFYFFYLRIPVYFSDYFKVAICYGLMTTFSDLYTVQMLYWHTACITYFYMPMLMIVFLIPFRQILAGKSLKIEKWSLLSSCFLAFCLGMSQEVVGAITVAFIGFVIAYQLVRKKRPEWTQWLLLALSLVGFLLLILSPGNGIRQAMPTFSWWNESGIVGKIRHGLGQFIYNQYHAQNWIMTALILVSSISICKTKKSFSKVVYPISFFIIAMLVVFFYGDNWMNWDILGKWKYTQDYFNMLNPEVLFPILVYGAITCYLIILSVVLSIQKKDIIYFLISSAVLCSNITVLFSSVGTSYISFPGIMLTLGMIMYLVPELKNTYIKIMVVAVCVFLFAGYIKNESSKMRIVAYEEQNRIANIQEAIKKGEKYIELDCYSQRVWEGNTISEEFRKCYGISEDIWIEFIE